MSAPTTAPHSTKKGWPWGKIALAILGLLFVGFVLDKKLTGAVINFILIQIEDFFYFLLGMVVLTATRNNNAIENVVGLVLCVVVIFFFGGLFISRVKATIAWVKHESSGGGKKKDDHGHH